MDLHVYELDITTIAGGNDSKHIKAATVAKPRWPIFQYLRNLYK